MSRRVHKLETIIEWKKIDYNIGCFRPEPTKEVENIWQNYLSRITIPQLVDFFFEGKCKSGVGLFDLAALSCFCFHDYSIKSARHVWFENPKHSSIYTFDKEKDRLQIKFRQNDLDGTHWVGGKHIHTLVGLIDAKHQYFIDKPRMDLHVPLLEYPSNIVSF